MTRRKKEIPSIVATLTALRIRRGWSQGAIGKKVGTSQSAISDIEKGVTNPTLATLERLGDVYGLKLIWTFDGE